MNRILPALVSALLFSATAWGQTNSTNSILTTLRPVCSSGQASTLSTTGRSAVAGFSDVAKISVSVSASNASVGDALSTATSLVSKLVDTVSQVNGIAASNVSTTSFSVYPQRQNNSTINASPITGYQVYCYLTIAVQNTTSAGLSAALQAASSISPNVTVSSTSFSQSPQAAFNTAATARAMALEDAKSSAQAYAKVLGASLGDLLSVADDVSYSSSSPSTVVYPSGSPVDNGSGTVNIVASTITMAVTTTYTLCSGSNSSSSRAGK